MYPAEHFRDVLGLMTVDELCAALEVKPETLARWRVNGEGPRYTKLGKSVFYRRADVRVWIANSTYAAGPLPHNTNAIEKQLDLEDMIEELDDRADAGTLAVSSGPISSMDCHPLPPEVTS